MQKIWRGGGGGGGVKKSNPGGVMKEVKTNTPKYSKSNMRLSFYVCLNRWPSKSF